MTHRLVVAAVGLLSLARPLPAQERMHPGVVRGIVYDSVGRAPLAGAFVQLMQVARDADGATRRGATSDSAGRYVIGDVPEGRFLLGFYHPKLDSLGVEAPVERGMARHDADAVVDLAVPSPTSVVTAHCGRRAAVDSSGLLAGFVLRASDDQPPASSSVQARWNEIVIDARGAHAASREATAVTGAGGFFLMCGVPPGAIILVRVTAEADSGSLVELEVPDNGILVRPLYIGGNRASTARDPGDSRPAPTARLAYLTGTVQSQFGEPLNGARVRLWGSPHETTTNSEGVFSFSELPVGSHTLEARAIGYVPLRVAVDLFPARSARAALVMGSFPTIVDTVKVFAVRPKVLNAPPAFEARRRLGFGSFLDAEEIERRGPQIFTDLLRMMPGVLVAPSGATGQTVRMHGNNPTSLCEPLLVLDGMRVPLEGMSLNDLIPTHVVRAVEIYPRRLEAPPEYQSFECGTIVVWTGARGWLARRATAPRFVKPKKSRG